MNRDALLIYLHDLRDLEAAKYQITKIRQKNLEANKAAAGKIQSEINAINTANYMKMPSWPSFGEVISDALCNAIFFGSMGGMSAVIMLILWNVFHIRWDFFTGCLIFASPIFIVFIWSLISPFLQYKKRKAQVKEHNKKEKERLEFFAPSQISQKKRIKKDIMDKGYSKELYLKDEFQKVTDLLQEAYSLNILAKPYRNLPSVYYIYEYMSTSQASLEETFMHEHMENGFQRIEKKLDIIIEQNEEIIFATRQIEANTARTVEQTTNMLNNLQKSIEIQERTEQNTLEAAQYASISATYSKATAFFSAANYLSQGTYR